MRLFYPAVTLAVLAMGGCSAPTRKCDLDQMMGKVEIGMNEVQVTQILGAPTRIDVVDGRRLLRYEGTDGGFLVVSLIGNRVTDARRHNKGE